VLVAPEKHDRACVVQLVHGVEVPDQRRVDRVDDGEVLDQRRGFEEVFVLGGLVWGWEWRKDGERRVGGTHHGHALGIGVGAEADHDEVGFFGEDGLVDVPGGGQVGEEHGTHRVLLLKLKSRFSKLAKCGLLKGSRIEVGGLEGERKCVTCETGSHFP